MNASPCVRLLVTAGDGPRECRRAVSLCLGRLEREALRGGLYVDIVQDETEGSDEIASALVTLRGSDVEQFARRWIGTVQWIANSPYRPHHRRRNWFIGIFELGALDESTIELKDSELRFEAFRAGGPGGQHQNTTDSAVRLTHVPTGMSVVVRSERSQHRNKQIARERLVDRFLLMQLQSRNADDAKRFLLHRQIERGNPVRVFRGETW